MNDDEDLAVCRYAVDGKALSLQLWINRRTKNLKKVSEDGGGR